MQLVQIAIDAVVVRPFALFRPPYPFAPIVISVAVRHAFSLAISYPRYNGSIPAPAPALETLPILDVGCGINKHPGAIGIDRNPHTRADVIADLDRFPWPLADNSFREIRAIHVIEHVADIIRTMEEFHRLLAPGGRAVIVTPHYTDFSSFCDPTHRWHLNSFSLRYFGNDSGGFSYYSPARFREISTKLKLLALWRYLGFELLVNHSRWFRRFWEFYLCYLVRGKVIEWQLEAIKNRSDRSTPDSYSGN